MTIKNNLRSGTLRPIYTYIYIASKTLSAYKLYSVDVKKIKEYGAVGGMRFVRRNRKTPRKTSAVLHPSEIPHALAWN
jgi:hypothetical protein